MFKKIKQNGKRLIIVGDIHGSLTKLIESLEYIGFDTDYDTLVSVGDLIDRGPENLETLEWFEKAIKSGNVHMVRGNHDDFLVEFAEVQAEYLAKNPNIKLPAGVSSLWMNNGGSWAAGLPAETIQHHAAWLKEQPYQLEILTDNGLKYGVVHAEIWDDWEITKAGLDTNRTQQRLTWGRTKIQQAAQGYASRAEGVDVLFCGHSVVQAATTVGNQVYLDTGAVFDKLYNTEIPGAFSFAIIHPNTGKIDIVRSNI